MEVLLLTGLAIFALAMFMWGYTNGFIRITFTLVITIVVFFVSMFLSDPFEKFLKSNTGMYKYIEKKTTAYVEKQIPKEKDIATVEIQNESIKDLQLPDVIKDKLIKNNTADIKLSMGTDTFTDYLSKMLADMLMHALAMTILFVLLKVAVKIAVVVLNIVSRLPVIHGVNKILGGALGIVDAIVIIWIACIVLMATSGTHLGGQVMIAISNNSALSFIYNNNPLLNLSKII